MIVIIIIRLFRLGLENPMEVLQTCSPFLFFCQHIFTAIKRNFVSLDFHKIGELKVDIFLFFRFFFLDLGLHFLIDHSRIYSINASERNICTKEETY